MVAGPKNCDQMCLRFAAPKFNLLGFFGEASPKMHEKVRCFRNFTNFAHMAFLCALFGMVKRPFPKVQ